ncbi:MAG: hypothetical protein IKS85_09500 [Lachnospiraceae bacterium]|nr:hypothetical protein [Lachnospiraceae bacterium]
MRRRREKRTAVRASGRSYKFTNKKHPAKAIFAIILGVVSLIGICAAIYLSFRAEGATKPGYGMTGLLATIFSLTGTVLSVLSFRDRNSFYVLSWVGTILNLVVLVGIGFLFSLGI